MAEELRTYTTPGTITGIGLPPNTIHVQAYLRGGAADGVAGDGTNGGRGGGGAAFCVFDVDSSEDSLYSVTVGDKGEQSSISHILDNQATTGESAGFAGGTSNQEGAPASSCGRSGYGSGQIDYVHKGGRGADAQGEKGGGGGGGGRVIIDGVDATTHLGCALGGGNGGTTDSKDGKNATANSGGGGGGGHKNGPKGNGSVGWVRVLITTSD